MTMSPLTYEECVDAIGTLPTMTPEPSFQNRRKTHRVLCERLATLPSTKSAREGHRGVAELPYIWQSLGEQPWVYEPNPGRSAPLPAHRVANADERQASVHTWEPKRECYDTEQNVHRAIYAALRKAVPVDYHSNPTTGAAEWSINMTPLELFASLDPYCKPTSMMVANNEARIAGAYNHTEPIAKLFRRFEECRDIALASNTPFSQAQLLSKFILLMEKTGIYNDQVEEWEGKPTPEKTWANLKVYWLRQYLLKRNRPSSTMGQTFQGNPYANLADGELTDDDATIADDIATINTHFSAFMARESESRQAITALQAEVQSLRNGTNNPPPPTIYAPPPQFYTPPVYQQPPAPPTYQQPPPPPPAQHYMPAPPPPYNPAPHAAYNTQGQSGGGRGGGRGRGRGSGRGRGNHGGGYGQQQQQQYYTPQQSTQGAPAWGNQYHAPSAQGGAGQQRAAYSNTKKHFDNDLFCWSCGYDVNHDGTSCPKQRWGNHQPLATRHNLRSFLACGKWCLKNRHKVTTPSGHMIQWDNITPTGM